MILKMFKNKCTYKNKLVITKSFIFNDSGRWGSVPNPQNTVIVSDFVMIEQNSELEKQAVVMVGRHLCGPVCKGCYPFKEDPQDLMASKLGLGYWVQAHTACHNRPVNWEMGCWDKGQQLYSESEKTEMVD